MYAYNIYMYIHYNILCVQVLILLYNIIIVIVWRRYRGEEGFSGFSSFVQSPLPSPPLSRHPRVGDQIRRPHATAAARQSSRNWPHSRGSNCERGLPTTDRSLNAAERTYSRCTIPIRVQCVCIMPTRDDDKMRLVITRLLYTILYIYTNTHSFLLYYIIWYQDVYTRIQVRSREHRNGYNNNAYIPINTKRLCAYM